jgi:hypothetical protein
MSKNKSFTLAERQMVQGIHAGLLDAPAERQLFD